MKQMTIVSYDASEAGDLLGDFMERVNPDHKARRDAAQRLLGSLHILTEQLGLKTRATPDNLEVTAEGLGSAKVTISPDGQISIFSTTGAIHDVELRYNRMHRVLEGVAEDSFILPLRGAPRKRRSGLAVVVETLVSVLEGKPPAK